MVAASTPAARVGGAPLTVVDGRQSVGGPVGGRAEGHPPGPNPKNSVVGATAQQWRADERGLRLDRAGFEAARARAARRRAAPGSTARAWRDAAARHREGAFTRADLVEVIAAQVPVDSDRPPREVVEAAVDEMGMRLTGPRAAASA